jgi:hypothetical protein
MTKEYLSAALLSDEGGVLCPLLRVDPLSDWDLDSAAELS